MAVKKPAIGSPTKTELRRQLADARNAADRAHEDHVYKQNATSARAANKADTLVAELAEQLKNWKAPAAAARGTRIGRIGRGKPPATTTAAWVPEGETAKGAFGAALVGERIDLDLKPSIFSGDLDLSEGVLVRRTGDGSFPGFTDPATGNQISLEEANRRISLQDEPGAPGVTFITPETSPEAFIEQEESTMTSTEEYVDELLPTLEPDEPPAFVRKTAVHTKARKAKYGAEIDFVFAHPGVSYRLKDTKGVPIVFTTSAGGAGIKKKFEKRTDEAGNLLQVTTRRLDETGKAFGVWLKAAVPEPVLPVAIDGESVAVADDGELAPSE